MVENIILSHEIQKAIVENITEFCNKVRRADPLEALLFISSEEYLHSQANYYQSVMKELGIDPKRKKILEIGTGYGFFMVYAIKKLGWDVYGIEPSRGECNGQFELASCILDRNGIDKNRLINTPGENIKLASNSFDIVISNDVLEHVSDPKAVFQETYRVLKPGGFLVFNVPNYCWVYEGHYNMLWFPLMSKSMAKKYVVWQGRDPTYIDRLNFLTPPIIKNIIKSIPNAKFYLPLEYKTSEFMIQRVKAYIEVMEKRQKKGLSFHILRLLYVIVSRKIFKRFFALWARLTGIYHEMHIVVKKK